jgi:uncharacterized membrane protein
MLGRARSSFSDRRIAVLVSLAVLTLFVLAMIAFRVLHTGTPDHGGIAWNLVLAWIPFALALVVYARAKAGGSAMAIAGLSALWLLFFPNAPYIVTDLKHVGAGRGMPVLYDVLLLTAAAWTGLLLGLTSLFLVHAAARRLIGPVCAWALVVVVLAASSFGIYLGRVRRWNSWDVIVHPRSLLAEIQAGVLDPLSHPRPVAITILFTSFLLASYLVLYSFARLSSLVRE